MTGLFRTTVVEISGVRTIAGGGTNASNAAQALLNLSGVSIAGDQTISGIKTFASRPTVNGTGVLLSGDPEYSVHPSKLGIPYDVFTTGRITILSGLGPFERRVYSGSLGLLKNPNEAALIFAYTGRDVSQSMIRFFSTAQNSQFGGNAAHVEPLIGGGVGGGSVTDDSPRPSFPGGGATISTTPANIYASLPLSTQLLFVTKDYLKASTNVFFGTYHGFFSGDTSITLSSVTNFGNPQWPTGFSYINRQQQFGNGFILGFYAGPFGARLNPFGVQSANDSVNNQTGCSIMFEGSWLSDGPNNETWLNMAFKNYGPSGINRVGGTANPTGLTLNIYTIN
jgi:hypothetical protein